MSVWFPIVKIFLAVAFLLIGILYLDARSLALSIRRNRQGNGSSGVPLVALPLYALAVWLLPVSVCGLHKGYIFLGLLLYHVICHFILPRLHSLLRR